MARSARSAGFAALALAALAVAGCDPYVQGNCVYYEEIRTPAESITGVHLQDGIEATVTAGVAQQKVVVSGDANLVKSIRTEVVTDHGSGPVLHVTMDTGGTFDPCIPPRVVVEVADLRYVKVEEDSHVAASGVSTLLLTLEASGKSDVLVDGPGGGRVDAVASDARVDAGFYPVSEGALVNLSNGARVTLNSDGPVAGTVRGGCTLANLGTGSCNAVVVPAGEIASVCVPVP